MIPQEAPFERTPVSGSAERGDEAVGMGIGVLSWGVLEASLCVS